MDPPPIGFEMQNVDEGGRRSSHVTQIDVNYGNQQPQGQGVTPAPEGQALYPPIASNGTPENVTSPSQVQPIGFEGQVAGGGSDEKNAVVDMEKHPEAHAVNLGEESAEDDTLLDSNKDTPSKVVNEEATLYFRNQPYMIDYILAYEPGTGDAELKKAEKRKSYEDALRKEGLKLEYEGKEMSKSGKTCFVKIHAPWDVLTKYAELTNLKMPLAPNDMELELEGYLEHCLNMCPSCFELDEEIVPPDPNYFTAPFNRDRVEQFVIENKDGFFTKAQRSRLVHEVLSRAAFDDEKGKMKFGIRKLIKSGTYNAAFPLHDGKYTSEHSLLTRGKDNDRHLLYEVWAKPGAWYKYQPLDQIRNYFGEKVGIYFAWLGFYTAMLIPAALVGVVAFIYGLATFLSDIPSDEICDINSAGNFTMCPLCDGRCPYWKLIDSCNYSKATYLFDNYATVAFALFMAMWASFFHEFWKRKQAEIEYDWDVADFENEEETIRPEYEAGVKRRKKNPITKREEPYVPPWSKCCRYGTTFSILLFFLCLIVAAVFGVILYRIVITAVFYSNTETVIRSRAGILASATAALINLVIIIILNFFYQRIALFLTDLEQHRTMTEWEDALSFKMYLFQFVNYYSSILYVAFMKGRFVGRPGDYDYNLLDLRQEECNPAGCLVELCIQLGIVMVGKQTFNNFKEIVLPKLIVWFKSRNIQKDKSDDKVYARWEQDYNLADMPDLGLFDEYLEMVVQYGFITIFVAAFPLAPLFALINNVIEIRLDAYKFVTQWKRPLAARAQDIGIWFGILRGVSAIAVVSNAVIIAFTSEFITKLVYLYGHSANTTMYGYTDFSLSVFNVSQFAPRSVPDANAQSKFDGIVTTCRYRGFREASGTPNEYEYTMAFWHVLAGRLAFIVVFENVVVFATWLIMYLIPDMPAAVKLQMLRENFLAKEALYTAESIKTAKRDSGEGNQPLY